MDNPTKGLPFFERFDAPIMEPSAMSAPGTAAHSYAPRHSPSSRAPRPSPLLRARHFPARFGGSLAAALLAALMFLLAGAPAHAQTVVWNATLTSADNWALGNTYTYDGYGSSALGSITTTQGSLSPDAFTIGTTTHTVDVLGVREGTDNRLYLITNTAASKSDLAGYAMEFTVDGSTTTLKVKDATNESDLGFYWAPSRHSFGPDDWQAKTITVKLLLTVTEGHHAVKLDWTAPAADGGSAITGYHVTVNGGTSSLSTGSTSTASTVAIFDNNDYPFQVRAENANGNGPWSSAVTATVGPATVTIGGDGGVAEGAEAAFTLTTTKPVLSLSKRLNVSVLVSESEDMVASAEEGAKTVSFAPPALTWGLSVPTVDDGVAESDSVVTVAIQTNTDYTVGTDSSAMVTVSDAAPPPIPPVPPPPLPGPTQGSVATDRAALVALYDETGGGDWTNNNNWKSSAALSTWHGVITDFDGRVTQLYLGDNNLSGVIPTELGNLTNLRTLHLYGNSFLGRDLPLGLMNLNALTSVWIQRTGLCPPDDAAFLAWVAALDDFGGCTEPHTAPVVLSVATKSSGGDWIILTLSKALSRIPRTRSSPETRGYVKDFKFDVDGETVTPSSFYIFNGPVSLDLKISPAITSGQTVTLSYTARDGDNGSGTLNNSAWQDHAGNDLADFSGQAVTNTVGTPPGGGGTGGTGGGGDDGDGGGGTGGGGGGSGGTSQTVPDAPTNLLLERGDGQVTLTWEAPEDDGGSEITDYEYRINGQGSWISIGSTDTTTTVTGLDNDTVYTFEVRAVNRIGRSRASSDPAAATPRAAVALDFAHFANGEGITSDLVFVNVATHSIRPVLYFYDQEGNLIDPESVVDLTEDLEVTEDGALSVQKEMAPLGELTISTHGRGEVVSGSVKVVSEGPIGGVLRYALPGIGVTGVGASPPVRDALFPVRQEGGLATAAAIRNLTGSDLVVTCRLMKDGAVLEETEIPLAANGQEARYIEEMFTFTGADRPDFVGSVRCTVPPGEAMFTGVAVELDEGNRIFTTLPVVPVERATDSQE